MIKILILIFNIFLLIKFGGCVLTFISYSDKDCSREVVSTIYYDDMELFYNNGTHVLPLESSSSTNSKNVESQYEEINKCIKHRGGSMKILAEEYKLLKGQNSSSICVLEQNVKSKTKTDLKKKTPSIVKYTLNNEIILYRDGYSRLSCTNSHTRQYSCILNNCLLENEWENNVKISYDYWHLYFYKI
ncbi:hypothetical protein DICPUDRAFT_79592 [Dictyostelium purpureum]|uniref:Uncharacterized protein n=1 Tax=Dictyostelium purpureum TaxID=5786 RepID=F0ZN26_DICPU|nr:uncharacterized protein DICPUDRAFT_79592 [Dictyostelium purpureum]EGC34639.1 hypothetical protein DICPUDRAFT_79592 [Dictyostelium purpureum]|eukprot:XP_003288820.1 hypothetical protein DICPUDRAFT_79592 [Dictyostelium purpureum]